MNQLVEKIVEFARGIDANPAYDTVGLIVGVVIALYVLASTIIAFSNNAFSWGGRTQLGWVILNIVVGTCGIIWVVKTYQSYTLTLFAALAIYFALVTIRVLLGELFSTAIDKVDDYRHR